MTAGKNKPNTECTYLGTKINQTGDNTTEIKHTINQSSYKCFKFYLVAQRYLKKQKIIYLSNNNSEHFDVWRRSMANTCQRNKQNFIYRNGCAKEISKKSRMERIKNGYIKEIM